MSKRVRYMDLFRGIGIILMVMGHVGFGSGFYKFSHAFHMPMFFVVTGYFFRLVNFDIFIRKKLRTLILPYFAFGSLQLGTWLIIHRSENIQEKLAKLTSLLLTNTDGALVGGALWFLTSLFFAELLYYGLTKFFRDTKAITIVCLLIGFFGTIYNDIVSIRLFWGVDSALVGVLFIHVGVLFKEKLHKLLILKFRYSIALLFIGAILAMLNDPINMRTLKYSNPIMFWISALLLIVSLLNVCREIEDVKLVRFKHIISEIEYIGKNSIVYVCLNQFWISAISLIIPIGHNCMYQVAILLITLILLRFSALILMNTKLSVLVGYLPTTKERN